MRLFVAINLSEGTRSRIASFGKELRSLSKRGAFTRSENIHLTLAFIGECDDTQANAVRAAMYETDIRPFTITTDALGRFRRYGETYTWWAGIAKNEYLDDMQHRLAERITSKGVGMDDRKYKPHITFGREIVSQTGPWNIEPFDEPVGSIELMRSERIDGKLTYTTIYSKKAEE